MEGGREEGGSEREGGGGGGVGVREGGSEREREKDSQKHNTVKRLAAQETQLFLD